MTKTRTVILLFILFALLLGCSGGSDADDGEKIAFISVTENSKYAQTFDELSLGILYDFNLKLTQADQSWVNIWVEGYKNGEKTDSFHLIDLSFGLSPSEVTEGPLVFGMIPQSKDVLFFIKSPGASVRPSMVENIFSTDSGVLTMWDYAIGDDEVELEDGETKLLGVYRQVENSFRPLDYQNPDHTAQMIKEDSTLLLLKIKVEKRDRE